MTGVVAQGIPVPSASQSSRWPFLARCKSPVTLLLLVECVGLMYKPPRPLRKQQYHPCWPVMRTDFKQCQIGHEANTRASSPHRRWLRQAQQVPRLIRLCVVAVIALCAAVGFARGLRDIQDQNKKARATIFPVSLNRSKIWSPHHPVRYNNGTHIDDKYAFSRHLGGGQEGSVDLYIDQVAGETVVVKQMSSVARNQIPVEVSDDFLEATATWPTEIEAGLLLADDNGTEPYVPILDYFILQSPSGSCCWAMVSPLAADGTLLDLAEKEKDQGDRTVHEIDSIYRPMMEDLLNGLQSLHARGLCHNDIKPNNIFIRDSTSWSLGDLGNVRHPAHAWHATASWTRQNQWQDCQLNDVRRVLKTYLSFLRAASADKGSFDDDFWYRRSSWSLMFWDFQRRPLTASPMANLSRTLYQPRELDDGNDRSSNDIRDSNGMAKATERELLCTSIPSDLWFVRKPV